MSPEPRYQPLRELGGWLAEYGLAYLLMAVMVSASLALLIMPWVFDSSWCAKAASVLTALLLAYCVWPDVAERF